MSRGKKKYATIVALIFRIVHKVGLGKYLQPPTNSKEAIELITREITGKKAYLIH